MINKKFTNRKIRDCNFEGVKFIEQDAYQDHRGYYYTVYDDTIDSKNNYVRDKISSSSKNVLRGIHGDYKTTKLITCVHGEVYCVIVDNREDSKTFAEWSWEILSLHNRNILVLPPGVFITITLLFFADTRSILSTPAPALPITFNFFAAEIIFFVTFVADLTTIPSYSGIILIISSSDKPVFTSN